MSRARARAAQARCIVPSKLDAVTAFMSTNRLATRLHDDPRSNTETSWLDMIDLLAARLGEATSARVEVGSYWINDAPGDCSAGLNVRVRARAPLRGVQSDAWEAGISLDEA